MRKLGRNLNGYVGERIDIEEILTGVRRTALETGWQLQSLDAPGEGELLALRREPGAASRRVYLSTGIHGDEPAGPLAMRQLLAELPQDVAFFCCPCLNPSGFKINRRENVAGLDLNRDYRNPRSEIVRAHTTWLRTQPAFDLALCLHEDWEAQGFYLYELNPDNAPSLAGEILRRVSSVCPVDVSPTIEGRPAREGVVRPPLEVMQRPDWPESFFLIEHKTRLSYTLEAPSDFPLATRVDALVQAVLGALSVAFDGTATEPTPAPASEA